MQHRHGSSTDVARIRLPRVRTGCLPCKAAHVKCDETKPVCHRCTRAVRACSFPAPPGTRPKEKDALALRALSAAPRPLRPLLPARPLLLTPPRQYTDLDDPNAALYFDRFKSQAARYRSATDHSDDFWFRTLLRETANDNGILTAVLGLGALAQSLGQAGHDVSLFSPNSIATPDPNQASYRDALRYYSLSIASMRKRFASPESVHDAGSPYDGPPSSTPDSTRYVLISSILYSAFELMHGNSAASDRIVAKTVSMLRKLILHQRQPALPALERLSLRERLETWRERSESTSPPPDVPCLQAEPYLDDDGMEEAEWLLVRRITLGAMYAPVRPLSRDLICSLPALEYLSGSMPPPPDASATTYWKLYLRWQPLTELWFIQGMAFRTPAACGSDTGSPESDGAGTETQVPKMTPLKVLLEERETLLEQMKTWQAAAHAKLAKVTTTEDTAMLRHILLNCKNLHYHVTSLFGSAAAPEKRQEMRTMALEIIEMSEQAIEVLPRINEGRDEMRENLYAVCILMSQNCRDSGETRRRAMALCRRLTDSRSRWDAKGVVMGTSKLIEIEEEGCEEDMDRVPDSAQWNWTLASWNMGYTELTVVYTPKPVLVQAVDGTVTSEVSHVTERTMVLRPEDYGY
ncbi:RNA polymerase II-specific transcription factor-like protein [Microdochium nivale]|nr:RNA polymerase II-specific transcription factor-like protein [Microdochium nivale]